MAKFPTPLAKLAEKITLYGGAAILVWHLITYYSDHQTDKALKEKSDKDYDKSINDWKVSVDSDIHNLKYELGMEMPRERDSIVKKSKGFIRK